jgi:hypothetical protein
MITIEMQDDILHTDESPHCDDPTCPCWTVLEEPAVDAFLARREEAHAAYSPRDEF